MGYRRDILAIGEWFHCYTRTIDRSRPFTEKENVRRFLETLYLANQVSPMPVFPELYKRYSHNELFSIQRTRPLVAIGAYSIMPTHYHLMVQPLEENGLSKFMHKAGTGFTRFYNDRHERVGNLFIKPFRSKHIATEGYFGRVATYIHLNPIELFEPKWKEGAVKNFEVLETKLLSYSASSLIDYEGISRAQRAILDTNAFLTLQEYKRPLRECLEDAAAYYQSLDLDV